MSSSSIPVIQNLESIDPEFLNYLNTETTGNVPTSHPEIPAERELWMTSGHSFPVVHPVKLTIPSAEEMVQKLDSVQKAVTELQSDLSDLRNLQCELLQVSALVISIIYYFSLFFI